MPPPKHHIVALRSSPLPYTSFLGRDGNGVIKRDQKDMAFPKAYQTGVSGALCPSPFRKLRWHSFQNSHRPSLNSESLEINRQFAGQINLLHKGSLLRLTGFMEKYTVPHKQAWVW